MRAKARKFPERPSRGPRGLVLLAVLGAHHRGPVRIRESSKRLQKANEGEALFKRHRVPGAARPRRGGFAHSRVVPSYAGLRGGYYRITADGRAMLRQWSDIWRQTRGFVVASSTGTRLMSVKRSPLDR